MSATVVLRPTAPTARALESRALQSRWLENRVAGTEITGKYFDAGRKWLAQIDDAAALLELEDRLSEVLDARFYRGARSRFYRA
jgi:hypothetical protein